jgi:hypothetical protein
MVELAEEVFVNCYNFKPIKSKRSFISRYLIELSGAGAGEGAGAEIRICGSVDLEPKEIFSAPQHCV